MGADLNITDPEKDVSSPMTVQACRMRSQIALEREAGCTDPTARMEWLQLARAWADVAACLADTLAVSHSSSGDAQPPPERDPRYDRLREYLRHRFDVGGEVYRRRWGLPPD